MKKFFLIFLLSFSARAQSGGTLTYLDSRVKLLDTTANDASTNTHGFQKKFPGVGGQIQNSITGAWQTNQFRTLADFATGTSGIPGDGLSDDLALTNALAAGVKGIILPPGVWNFSTNLTTGDFVKIWPLDGAFIKVASGKTLNFAGPVRAEPGQWWIDTSAGGHVTFKLISGSDVSWHAEKWANWWGPDPTNSGATDSSTQLQEWLNSVTSGSGETLRIMPGIYRHVTGLTMPYGVILRGEGAQLNFAPSAANTIALTMPGGNGTELHELIVRSTATAGAGAGNTKTNIIAVYVSPAAHDVLISRLTVMEVNGVGLALDGGTSVNGILNSRIIDCTFKNCRNDSTHGGNGLTPAIGCSASNTLGDVTFIHNKYLGNDASFVCDSPTAPNSAGEIKLYNESYQSAGNNGIVVTNSTVFNLNGSGYIRDCYWENNYCAYAARVGSTKGLIVVQGGVMAGNYGGGLQSTNLFLVNANKAVIEDFGMGGTATLFVKNQNANPILLSRIWATDGSSDISESTFAGKISGAYQFSRVGLEYDASAAKYALGGAVASRFLTTYGSFEMSISGGADFIYENSSSPAASSVKLVSAGAANSGFDFQTKDAGGTAGTRMTLSGAGTLSLSNFVVTAAGTVTGATVASSANTIKITDYLQWAAPDMADGTGAIIDTTALNPYSGQALISGSAATNANYIEYRIVVPKDIDTSVDLKLSYFKLRLNGADTSAATYNIGMADVADSAAYAGTIGNWVALSKTADAAGASGDVNTIANVTLTGWKSALTAGDLWVIRINRDGANDTSNVAHYSGPLMISYGRILQ